MMNGIFGNQAATNGICVICGVDISHKKSNAKYCSKKCYYRADSPLGKTGIIYAIGFSEFVKIGFTRWRVGVEERIKALQTACPLKLEIYKTIEGSSEDERALHRRFEKYRLEGEWFRKEGELAEWIKTEGLLTNALPIVTKNVSQKNCETIAPVLFMDKLSRPIVSENTDVD